MASLSDDEVLAGHHDLEMMRRPHLWPNRNDRGGVLPLKRRRPTETGHEYATLIYYGPGEAGYVFVLSSFTQVVRSDLAGFNYITGQDALLCLLDDAGWKVD